MGQISRVLFIFLNLLSVFCLSSGDTFNVKIGTDQHVNTVDRRFLSFTVDPKYLFSSTERYNSKECICMASSLTPAYLRIAGPSTSHLIFKNSSISIDDHDVDEVDISANVLDGLFGRKTTKRQVQEKLTLSDNQWKKFVTWANTTGFELVFALNNNEKTASGMWDPNTALDILTAADKVNIGDIYWQLGYECNNQSIEEYLNDLQTLRVIVETFPPGKTLKWKVVGSDVTNCLQADSKSDFKDYVTLSLDMMDSVMLNGNSSSRELERMSEFDRLKLLKLLSVSETPLWITESSQRQYTELERAADWMASLGYSARNGFSVHYRELLEEELFQPTLSFYMALLFKNLVGERVLSVDMESTQAALFAHCTSLRHKPVFGAVTLYGANMDDEPARFSIKLSKREEGGDIMQFILGYDSNGNIVVNGRAMIHEGDIKPVIKRVRPYKTLLINLPPKSFGFWVLANTTVDACYHFENDVKEKQFVEALDVTTKETSNRIRRKRSLAIDDDLHVADVSNDFSELKKHFNKIQNQALKKRIDDLNRYLRNVHKSKENKVNNENNEITDNKQNLRRKRQLFDGENSLENRIRKIKKHLLKPRFEKKRFFNSDFKKNGLFGGLLRNVRNDRGKKTMKIAKSKVSKKDSKNPTEQKVTSLENSVVNKEKVSRTRRSVVSNEKHNLLRITNVEKSDENEIDTDVQDNTKLWKVLNKIQKQLNALQMENRARKQIDDEDDRSRENSQILVKTKMSDDGAIINFSEHPNHGLIKSTFENAFSVLGDLNNNLNRFWNALTLLE